MKMILAVIRPEKLEAVRDVLAGRGLPMTVGEVLGFGREQGPVEMYRGATVRRPVTKLRVEVSVPDGAADAVVESLLDAIHLDGTDAVSDDRVLVLDLDACVRAGSA